MPPIELMVDGGFEFEKTFEEEDKLDCSGGTGGRYSHLLTAEQEQEFIDNPEIEYEVIETLPILGTDVDGELIVGEPVVQEILGRPKDVIAEIPEIVIEVPDIAQLPSEAIVEVIETPQEIIITEKPIVTEEI